MKNDGEKPCSSDLSKYSIKKVKRKPGRKPGYRMENWQKEIQLASLRNRDLEKFNIFLKEFVEICKNLRGALFCLLPAFPLVRDLDMVFPGDYVFVLERVFWKTEDAASGALFFYSCISGSCRNVCYKSYEQYRLVNEGKLFPVDGFARECFCRNAKTAAEGSGLRFAGCEILGKWFLSPEWEKIEKFSKEIEVV